MASQFVYYNRLAMLNVGNTMNVRNCKGTAEKLNRGLMTVLKAVAMHRK
jgi:hypothetical protein